MEEEMEQVRLYRETHLSLTLKYKLKMNLFPPPRFTLLN